MKVEDHPFTHVTDPELLSPQEKQRYQEFFLKLDFGERFGEIMRLNRAKWGDEVFDRGIDKTRLELVDIDTGNVIKVLSSKDYDI